MPLLRIHNSMQIHPSNFSLNSYMDRGHKTDMTNADHCIVKPNGKFTRKGKDLQIVWKARGHKRYKENIEANHISGFAHCNICGITVKTRHALAHHITKNLNRSFLSGKHYNEFMIVIRICLTFTNLSLGHCPCSKLEISSHLTKQSKA